MRILPIATLLFFFFLFGCLSNELKKETIVINGVKIDALVADTESSRDQGLMGIKNLGQNEGMIFVFERPGDYAFWMKDTLIPLDILFISENNTIVNIQQMEPCTQDPCELYVPSSEIMYAIEVNSGFAERNNVTVGEQIKIE